MTQHSPAPSTLAPLGTSELGDRLRIGFITHLDQHDDLATIYGDNIRLIQALEDQGYDSAWIATRHFHSGWAALPSPYVFLGAAAASTRHIALGTAVLPLIPEDPIRAAEDVSVLDHLSGGRLLLGVGKGVPSDSYQVFSRWAEDREGGFEDKLDQLHWALDGGLVPGGSESIWPPNPALAGRVFAGTSNPETIRAAARRGDGFILERFGNGPERTPENRAAFHERQARSVREYRRVFAETWAQSRTPYVVSSRTAYPGTTTSAALAEAAERTAQWYEQGVTVGRADPAHTPAEHLLSDNAAWGDPASLAADLLADPTTALTDELVLGIHPARHSVDETIAKAATLFEEAVPLIRAGWAEQRAAALAGLTPETAGAAR